MAALVCEICGGKLITKAGGICECESCGMLFDKSWVREKIQEIRGTVQVEGTVEVTGTVAVDTASAVTNQLKRGKTALEDGEWEEAAGFFEKVLDVDAENGEAFLGLHMAEKQLHSWEEFCQEFAALRQTSDKNLQRALRADSTLQGKLDAVLQDRDAWVKKRSARLREKRNAIFRANRRCAQFGRLISPGYSSAIGMTIQGKPLTKIVDDNSVAAQNMKGVLRGDASRWAGLVQIANGANFIAGLTEDGRVLTAIASDYLSGPWQEKVAAWEGITQIAAASNRCVGLREDGTVVVEIPNGEYIPVKAPDWTNIVSICASYSGIAGLKADGTVVVDGDIASPATWRDVIAIEMETCDLIGLRADGTVYTTNDRHLHACTEWRDIIDVVIGSCFAVGLKADGTVVATGENQIGQCNVDNWRNIVAVSAGNVFAIGIQADGTVVQTASSAPDWKLFNNVPEAEVCWAEQDKRIREATAQRAVQRRIAAQRRQEAIAALQQERMALQAELPTLKGVFSGKRRKEIETRIAQIDAELGRL